MAKAKLQYHAKLRSAQPCGYCGETMHGGQPAYSWLLRGRRHYRHVDRPQCTPQDWEREDDPEVAEILRELAPPRKGPPKPKPQTAAEMAALRRQQLAEIRGRYEPDSLKPKALHRYSKRGAPNDE